MRTTTLTGLLDAHQTAWHGRFRHLLLLKWALCGAFLSAMAFSPYLWRSDRAYPTVPAFDWVPTLPDGMCLAITALLAACALAIAILPNPGKLPWLAVALCALLSLFDLTRLQPWFYQYMLMLVGLGTVKWEDGDAETGWAICAFVIAALYLWSGLQKANVTFSTTVFPQILEPLGIHGPPRFLGYAASFTEAAIGVLLLVPRTRTLGVVIATAMHLMLVVALGPLGLDHNAIVWPWNLWMIAFVAILFLRRESNLLSSAWRRATGKVVMTLAGIMPLFSFFGIWDSYLSASLYSGNTYDAWIILTEKGALAVPEKYLEGHGAFTQRGDAYQLYTTQWAMETVNVPAYPETRAYLRLVRQLEREGVPAAEMYIILKDRPPITSDARVDRVIRLP